MFKKLRQHQWFPIIAASILILLTLTSRICVAYFLANDDPGDGIVYARLATNLLEQHVYSLEPAAPFNPTLVRLPGYPLFLAAVYAVCGHGNNTAVRLIQAIFDTGTCGLIAALAWQWTDAEAAADDNDDGVEAKNNQRRKRSAFWALILAALSPFIVIYTATILTETLTTFLIAAMALTATLAFKAPTAKRSLLWWALTGLLGGMAVMFRPDSGLFAFGLGLTLIISSLFRNRENASSLIRRMFGAVWRGAVFSLAFALILVPWIVRNYQTFGVLQPLAPAHGEMPGEFVSRGYNRWLRTWVDDERYVEPTLWNLNEKQIKIDKLPASAFDSDTERDQAAALLNAYNHPPGSEVKDAQSDSSADNPDDEDNSDDSSGDGTDSATDQNKDQSDNTTDQNAAAAADDQSQNDDSSDSDDEDSDAVQNVKMTPEIDAGLGGIADERIARDPFRYYVSLPLKRAGGMWFSTHSLYYPFGGEYSPTDDLDFEEHQQIWLPLFGGLVWIHTLLAVLGALVLWHRRKSGQVLRWLLLIALMMFPRILFFSSIENPESRYLVELFVFTTILGGIFIGHYKSNRLGENITEVTATENPKTD